MRNWHRKDFNFNNYVCPLEPPEKRATLIVVFIFVSIFAGIVGGHFAPARPPKSVPTPKQTQIAVCTDGYGAEHQVQYLSDRPNYRLELEICSIYNREGWK